jgi:hypothetical protein
MILPFVPLPAKGDYLIPAELSIDPMCPMSASSDEDMMLEVPCTSAKKNSPAAGDDQSGDADRFSIPQVAIMNGFRRAAIGEKDEHRKRLHRR